VALTPLFAALLVLGQAGTSAPASPTAGRVLSWDLARSFAKKLEALEKRPRQPDKRSPQRVVVSEGELNSYLNLGLGTKMPPGLSNLDVVLDSDRIVARALVDLEQVKDKGLSPGPWNPLAYLGGSLPLEVKGSYRNAEANFGELEVEEMRLGAFPVPMSLLEQIVLAATRTHDNPRGFDIHAPFRLPYYAKRFRLQRGQVAIEF
jgi:hypothetical protein